MPHVNVRSHDLRLDCPHEEAIERVTDALAAEGFGVLSRIDVHDKFRQKLDVEFRPYTILGACSPEFAHVALDTAPEIGLLLPCNVTVEQDGEGALVRIVNAVWLLDAGGYGEHPTVGPIGREADERLRRVADALKG